jgi:hypothetical protein
MGETTCKRSTDSWSFTVPIDHTSYSNKGLKKIPEKTYRNKVIYLGTYSVAYIMMHLNVNSKPSASLLKKIKAA